MIRLHVAACKIGGRRDPHYRARVVSTADNWSGYSIEASGTADTAEEASEAAIRETLASYGRLGLRHTVAPEVDNLGVLPRIDVESNPPIFAAMRWPFRR